MHALYDQAKPEASSQPDDADDKEGGPADAALSPSNEPLSQTVTLDTAGSNKADLGALVDGLDVGGGAEDEEDDLLALMDMAG